MFRRLGILGLVFLLAFYPAAAFAEETVENEDNDSIETTEVQADDNTEEADEESTDSNNDESEDAEDNSDATEDSDSNEAEDVNKEETDANDETTEVADEEVETDEETEASDPNEEQAEDEEEEEETEVLDEDLDLTQIHGAANQRSGTSIEYDFNKGYYVLDLQVGLSNMSGNQVLTDKWVAFALPNGVFVPDVEDVPSGMVPVTLYDGSNGLAFKIPNVGEFPDSKYVYHKVPLAGEPNDNNPNRNLYLLNVDVDAGTFEDLGQIKSQRNIDFDPMKGEPVLDLDATMTGDVTFDEENHHYVLDLTVNATNNAGADVNSLYAGFALPEGVGVVQNESMPADIAQLDDDGERVLAVKLPSLADGESDEVTYQIPIIGQTDAVVTSSTINTYIVEGDLYRNAGQFAGSVNVDFSNMDKAWTFTAKSQIVKDFPELDANQFGLRFAFEAQNLTVEDVDAVQVEFNVPNDITILETDGYKQGDIPDSLKDFLGEGSDSTGRLDIEWDGNTALINLDTMASTEWNQGFFTAFGESTRSLDDLEGLNVTVKLMQGENVVEEIQVPFEIVSYEGETPKDPEDPTPTDPQPEDPTPEDPSPGTPGTPGPEDPTPTDPGSDGTNGDDTTDPAGDDNDNIVIDGGNGSAGGKDSVEGNKTAGSLPDTATNMFTLILVGSILTIVGGVMFIFRRRTA